MNARSAIYYYIVAIIVIGSVLAPMLAPKESVRTQHPHKDDAIVWIEPEPVPDLRLERPDIDAFYPRPNACRTYPIGGYDATDGVQCETEQPVVVVEKPKRDKVTVTSTEEHTPPEVTPPSDEPKKKCNKGGGNGGEGCDPGNHPEKGSDDESGNKEKKK